MNRRAFLAGIIAAAAAPAFAARVMTNPCAEVFMLSDLQNEIARRVREHWDREMQRAFVRSMEQLFLTGTREPNPLLDDTPLF